VEEELVDQAVRLLSTAIGMIMEDHVDEALTTRLLTAFGDHAISLRAAGEDITILAQAVAVLQRRREGEARARTPSDGG